MATNNTTNAKATNAKPKLAIPETPLSMAQQSTVKTFLWVTIGGTALAVIIGGYFIWQLARQNVKTANQIKAQDIYINLAQKKVNNLKQADAKLADLKQPQGNAISDFDLVTQRALPVGNDLGLLLTVFQKLQTQTLIQIDNVSKVSSTGGAVATGSTTTPAATSGNGKAQSFPVTFKATGSYDQIQSFLKDLETSTRVFDFSNLKIDSAGNNIALQMTYTMYYLPKPSINDTQQSLEDYQKGHK